MKFCVRFNCNLSGVVCLIIALWCYNFVGCEVVRHQFCDASKNCQILNTSIDPCPEALQNKPCKAYRGKDLTWSFDYIPKFSGSKLTFQLYGLYGIYMPLPGQDRDACKFTECPVVADKFRHLQYTTPLFNEYPAGPWQVKLKLWSKPSQQCCFIVNIEIV